MTEKPNDAWAEHEARLRGHQLTMLDWHWGEAYKITWSNGEFRVTRRDNGATFSDADYNRISDAIREDYASKPVPREQS